MGTKNNPGKFDCYAHAAPDEPMFVLLGRDPCAPTIVAAWIALRKEMGDTSPEKLGEALDCAKAMTSYAYNLGKAPQLDKVMVSWRRTLLKTIGRLMHLKEEDI